MLLLFVKIIIKEIKLWNEIKFLVISMAAVLSLSLAGCSSASNSTSSSSNGTVAVKELKGEELNKNWKGW